MAEKTDMTVVPQYIDTVSVVVIIQSGVNIATLESLIEALESNSQLTDTTTLDRIIDLIGRYHELRKRLIVIANARRSTGVSTMNVDPDRLPKNNKLDIPIKGVTQDRYERG